MQKLLLKEIKAFKNALRGLFIIVASELHAKIHFIVASLVLLAAWFFEISSLEWCIIIFAIGAVISAECLNTAIEHIVDFISPEYDTKVGKIKDIAAAAVLVMSIASACIGLIIFLPKVIKII